MSKRALEILAVLVLALAVAVLVDRPASGPAAVADRVLPGFSAAAVRRVTLRAPGRPEIVVERAGDGFALAAPVRAPADPDAVRDSLGTLEYLAYRRRVAARDRAERGLDAPRLVVDVEDAAGGAARVRVGATEPLLGRVWVDRGGADDFLVDDYAVRALDRRPDDLRLRAPFRGVTPARIVLVAGARRLVLRGGCVEIGAGCAAADPARLDALREHLADLTVTRFLAEPPAGAPALHVEIDAASLDVLGACPGVADERAVRTPLGAGCVAGAAAEELAAAASAPEAWVAASPLTLAPPDVDRIEAGGVGLARRGGGWSFTDGRAADAEAVRAWLDVLRSYRGPVVPAPAAAPVATIRLIAGTATEELALLPGDRVRRDDEPVALALHPSVRAVFHADAATFADRRVLTFEPYALAAIDVVEPGQPLERAVRGATSEAWHLVAPLPLAADPARVDAVRQTASALRAERVVAARPFAARRTLVFATDPPPDQAAPARHTLELGADAPEGGCYARRAGADTVYLLGAAACATLGGHLAARRVFAVAPEDVTAVTVGGARSERHGVDWYGGGGDALAPAAAAALVALVRDLAEAPAVAGYGPIPGGVAVVIEAGGRTVALHAAHGVYALDGAAGQVSAAARPVPALAGAVWAVGERSEGLAAATPASGLESTLWALEGPGGASVAGGAATPAGAASVRTVAGVGSGAPMARFIVRVVRRSESVR